MRLNARGEVIETLCRELGLPDRDALERHLGTDFRYVAPARREGRGRGRFVPENAPPRPETTSATSVLGVVNKFDVWHPFANMADASELGPFEAHAMESVSALDPGPMASRIDEINADRRYFIGYKCAGRLIQSFKENRGVERAMLDLGLNPDFARRYFGIVAEATAARVRRVMDAVGDRIDLVQFNDDLGTQTSLMISPAMFREFLLPHYRRVFGVIRGYGARVFMHSCGAVREALPDLVAAGLDILNPVQTRASGMDAEGLKRDFGDRIAFCGGVDVQSTLPFGDPVDVREEVESLVRTLGKGGGYVLDSTNLIQPDTRVENVLAMFAAGRGAAGSGGARGDALE